MQRTLLRSACRGIALPVLMAAVLAAGFLVHADDGAAAMNYRIAIPGLSAEPSGQLATPGADDVRARNVGTTVAGSLTAFGEIRNDSERTITNIRLRVTGVGSDGGALGTVTVSASRARLPHTVPACLGLRSRASQTRTLV